MFVEGYAPGSPSSPAVTATPKGAPTIAAPEARAVHAALLAAARPNDDADHAFDIHVLACLLAVALEESARERTTIPSALGLSGAAVADLLATWFPTFDHAPLALDGAAPEVEMEEEILRDLLKGYAVEGDAAPSECADPSVPPLPVPPSPGGRGLERQLRSPASVSVIVEPSFAEELLIPEAPTSPALASSTELTPSFPPPQRGRDREGGLEPSSSEASRSVEATPTLRAALADILPPVIARRAMRPDHLWQDLGLFDRGDLNHLLARHFPTLHAGNTANMRWKKYFYRKLCEAEGFALCTAPSCSVCADFASCFGSEDGESRMAAARRAVDLSVDHAPPSHL